MSPKIEDKIYQVDAFTEERFKGNPAAVMICDTMPSEAFMQNLAMEMNLSETAFVVPQPDRFSIRYFTPKAEIPVAGHPTLASAHILYELGWVATTEEITFEANVTTLKVKKEDDLIAMNFPQFKNQPIETSPAVKEILGFEPMEMYQSDYNWKIAVAESSNDIVNCSPVFSRMTENDLGHLIITAKSNSENEDFVVRCFVPGLGVNEDPVTGSAHCALTPLWAKKLEKNELISRQVSQRTGKLWLEQMAERVVIKGKAITVFEAKLK